MKNLRLALVLGRFKIEEVSTIFLDKQTRLLDVMVANLNDDRNKVRKISLHFLELVI